MQRRISLAILGTVAAALILAGLGTFLLERTGARKETVSSLRSEAQAVVSLVALDASGRSRQLPRFKQVVAGLRVKGIAFLVIGARGRVIGQLPDGVDRADLRVGRLRAGQTLSGSHGQLVYAMAPEVRPNSVIVAVLTRPVESRRLPGRWFVVAAGVTLAIGALVAVWLSGSLTRPLRRAEVATHRIAAGDLSTRVPEPGPNARDELADLARSINTMAEGLERSRGLERQFLLSVSHDLRTPLTSIRGYAEAISDGTAPDHAAAAGVILSESRRLERLVRDLLDLAKLDAQRFSFDIRPIEVNEVVTDTAEGFRREAEAAGVALTVDEDPARGIARVDPDRLAQVVANLAENALKYAIGSVRVGTIGFPDGVAIAVADDGPGIAADDLPYVFERLYVARHRPVRKESGSGLGLAIVRELAVAMGGAVDAESPISPDGRGTRMVVRFPAVAGGHGSGREAEK